MFHAAQKPVSVVQTQHVLPRKKVQLTKRSQRFEHAGFLQKRMTRSVDELERLHNEFDLANAAAPKFHVALELVRPDNVALDALLDTGDFIQQIGRDAFRVNERLVLPQEFIGQFAAAADSARLDQRQAFPGFAKPGIIIFHALKGPSQWPRRTFRSKTQVDAEKRASRMLA